MEKLIKKIKKYFLEKRLKNRIQDLQQSTTDYNMRRIDFATWLGEQKYINMKILEVRNKLDNLVK